MFVAVQAECGSRIFQGDDRKVGAEFFRNYFQRWTKAVEAETLAI
jgi:hypothetical protein